MTWKEKVHPEVARRVGILLANLTAIGLDVRVVQSLRTFAEQDALFKKRPKVTNARGGQSNHNYGLAVDLCPFVNNQPDWNDINKFNVIGREAKKLGLEWGGDWKFVDKPHVQLRGLSIKECYALYNQGGLPKVWARMYQILGGEKPATFIPTADDLLEFGDTGAEVLKLQKQLVNLKLLQPHEADGDFGKITKRAVTAFQRINGLTADGIVGPRTRNKLMLDLRQDEIKVEIPNIPAANTALENGEQNPPAVSEQLIPQNDSATPPPEQTQNAEVIANISNDADKSKVDAAQNQPTVEIEKTKPTSFGTKLTAFFTAVFTGQYIVPQFVADGATTNSGAIVNFIGAAFKAAYENRYLIFGAIVVWVVVKKANNYLLTSKLADINADPTKANVVLVDAPKSLGLWQRMKSYWRGE